MHVIVFSLLLFFFTLVFASFSANKMQTVSFLKRPHIQLHNKIHILSFYFDQLTESIYINFIEFHAIPRKIITWKIPNFASTSIAVLPLCLFYQGVTAS